MNASPPGALPPGRFTVGVIGTGRVGAVLGAALARVGHRVVAVSAVSESSRARAEAMMPAAQILSPPEVAESSDLVLIAVPDDQLPGLVEGLALLGAWRSGQLVAHTSGRYGIGVLQPAQRAGAVPLALHPVMTFTGTSIDVDRLSGASFGVTAPTPFLPVADALVLEMEAEPVHIEEGARPLYHAALALSANSLMTLVASGADLLQYAGVENPDHVLRPLLTAALDNSLRIGDAALTGPVARGDAETVRSHVDDIGTVSPQIADLYVALGRATARRAADAGLLTRESRDSVLEALESGEGDHD